MLKNYFLTALRNLGRNKLYTVINVFGLAAGLTACLLIGVYINHELSYDRFHTKTDRIARLTMEYGHAGTVNEVAVTGTRPGPQFKRIFPAVEEYARTYMGTQVVKQADRIFEEKRFLFADEAFFKIFSFQLLKGDASTVLNDRTKIVLSASAAKKYFAETDPLFKTVTIRDKQYTVSGVFADVPENSQLKFDMVTQFVNLGQNVETEQWWTANWITYLLIKDEHQLPKIQQQINAYMQSAEVRAEAGLEGKDYLQYKLEPLARVHLYSSLSGFEPNGSIGYVYLFAIIGIIILFIACANYTNLATAQSATRTSEIGMRKVMGASRKQIFFQFIGESSLVSIIAALIAFGTAVLLIPYFNNLSGRQFVIHDLMKPVPVISMIVFALVVGFLAGIYPALLLSGKQISGVLKTGFSFTGGKGSLRKGLIVFQFAVSVFLLFFTAVVVRQMNFLQQKNLGYNKDHLLVLPLDGKMAATFPQLKDAIATVPGVEAVTASYETPEMIEWGDGIKATDEKGVHDISLKALPVDLDFVRTMKMQMVSGRDFLESDFGLMDTSNNRAAFRQPYIINETLAKELGWTPDQALNRNIEKGDAGPIVGVVKDFNFESLHEPVKPLVIFLSRDLNRNFIVRISSQDIPAAIARMEILWKQRVPHRPFQYHFLDEDYNRLYGAEQRFSSLFRVAALLAVLLACLGLFGLAAFNTVQRTKEIGIRRVLGAGITGIALLLAGNILLLVSLSVVIALPLAWYAASHWLQNFAFRTELPLWMPALIALAILLLAFITVSYHSVRVSLIKPAKSLKTE